MNKLEQALEDYKYGLFEKADAAYEEILTDNPQNAQVIYLLSLSKMSQNRFPQALTLINNAINLSKNEPSFHQAKASILAKTGNFEDAFISVEKALDENPNLYHAQILASHIKYSMGDKVRAINHLKMAIKIDDSFVEAHVNLAKIKIDDGEIVEAINDLTNREVLYPEEGSIKMALGQAFIENGAYENAKNCFKQVLETNPTYDLAGLYYGITILQLGEVNNAEVFIDTFNRRYPKTREGIAALGLLTFKQNQFKQSAAYLEHAIGKVQAPLSWRVAFAEAKARIGDNSFAIKLYKEILEKESNNIAALRLAELYEQNQNYKKSKKIYTNILKDDNNQLNALLGETRCLLSLDKFKKVEKNSKRILKRNHENDEAIYLLTTSLLKQGKEQKALKILKKVKTENRSYKQIQGMILDKLQNFEKAMKSFNKANKLANSKIVKTKNLIEKELKEVQGFSKDIKTLKQEPVFVIGAQSTVLFDFVKWLHEQGVLVLNDRLVSFGRSDVLSEFKSFEKLKDIELDHIRFERKKYIRKITAMLGSPTENIKYVDALFVNVNQIALIRKYFPKAKVLLLTRNTPDIWLSQKVFGEEPVDSKDWNETINQIISMGLNLTQIESDKWIKNDKETLLELSEIFDKKLVKNKEEDIDYWRKSHFPKGHWKNYKQFLGQ